jgi:hypothetical protein
LPEPLVGARHDDVALSGGEKRRQGVGLGAETPPEEEGKFRFGGFPGY